MNEQGGWASPWCEVEYPERPMLRMLDESEDRAERQKRVEEKYRLMPTAELLAMNDKPLPRDEALTAHLEAWKRGLMDANGEARLLALLREKLPVKKEQAELTESDVRLLQQFGIDQGLVARRGEIHSVTDFVRVRSELGGAK